ncbi:MAG: helix-turn-helix domain-containing protein [Lachnospiraceae bacterium]
MNSYVTGATIKKLREERKLKQSDLGACLGVSDKTISKWETGKGFPDITLLEPLAEALKLSVPELLSGERIVNKNASANLRKLKFYVCPICGNVVTSAGELLMSCCGLTLPALEAEEPDEEHEIRTERVENESYVTLSHEMTKEHYISFLAYVTSNHCEWIKLYPEGNAEARFLLRGHGCLYAYCNKHGLFCKKI